MKKNQPLDQESLIEASDSNRDTKLQNSFEESTSIMQNLRAFALSVPDFRRIGKGNVRHRLADIIMLIHSHRSMPGEKQRNQGDAAAYQ